MSKPMHLLLRFGALALLVILAACNTATVAPDGLSVATVPDSEMMWDYGCDDGMYVEILGTGMGDREGTNMNNPAKLTIEGSDEVDKILAQVVIKHNNYHYVDADGVIFTAYDELDGVVESYETNVAVMETELGRFFEFIFDEDVDQIAYITAEVLNPQVGGSWYSPRAFTAHVFRSGDSNSVGMIVDSDLYGKEGRVSAMKSVTVPDDANRDVKVDLSIVDLGNYDGREAQVKIEAGETLLFEETYTGSEFDELLLFSKTVTLPEGVNTLEITVTSPVENGDSIFWSSLNVSYTCEEPEPEPGKIIVKKVTDPAESEQAFKFQTSYSDNFMLKDGEMNDSGDLAAGSYSVSELPTEGWTLDRAECSDGSAPGAITLSAGETVTCIFYNIEDEVDLGKGRFTGGGHVIVDDVRYNFGLTLHCDVELSNNLEINWGRGQNSQKWHIEKESLTEVLCYDSDPEQAPPVAPLDTMEAMAVGKLNDTDGSAIHFKIVDGGEPGSKDYIMVTIWAPGADPDTDEPYVSFEGYLKGGNLQAHYDQPHGSNHNKSVLKDQQVDSL